MIVDSTFVRWIKAGALTVCPIIFIDPEITGSARKSIIIHEMVHWYDQLIFGCVGAVLAILLWLMMAWPLGSEAAVVLGLGLVEGWCAGVFLWRALYLLTLPVKFNPFRRYWETKAMRAQGISDQEIEHRLRQPPYYLS